MTQPIDPFQDKPFDNEKDKAAIQSIKTSRILLPMLIGVAVVVYLIWNQFDPKEFAKINWTNHTFFWILLSVFFLGLRHFSYMTRLHLLSEGEFSWRKCFELIFIWEFSSAVSPTSVGGSAVALFVLSQEKLSTAKTTTIVIYTVILDALFFLIGLPALFLIFERSMVAPSSFELGSMGGGAILLITYFSMFAYSFVFFWGIFIDPRRIKQLLRFFCRLPFLRRYQAKAEQLGNDIILTSKAIRHKGWQYHVGAFLATAAAWTFRFCLVMCLIVALVPSLHGEFWTYFLIFARLMTMYVIMLLFPTPGGAGFAEAAFGKFLSDFIPATLALTIAIIWRLLAYYTYLFAGAIIVPNWIRNVLNQRRRHQ